MSGFICTWRIPGCDEHLLSLCRQFFIMELEESREFFNNQNRLLKLLFAMYNLLAANSELVCYFIIVLNNMVSASVISLVLPILVFLWAMLSVPRPTKRFWMTAIVYTEVKCLLIQLDNSLGAIRGQIAHWFVCCSLHLYVASFGLIVDAIVLFCSLLGDGGGEIPVPVWILPLEQCLRDDPKRR